MNLLSTSPGGSSQGVVAAVSPFPILAAPHVPFWGVYLGGFVSSSHSSSWPCLFQTAKILKISGTGHGVPAWLSPLGMVCACVWCWVLSPAWHLDPGEGPNNFLSSSCQGVELSFVPLVPKEQGFFEFSLFSPVLSKTHFLLLRGLPKEF